MNHKKPKNIFITSIGQFFSMLMQFVIVFIITKEGGLKDIGIYGLMTSIVVPITTFFLFDIKSSVIAENHLEENFSKYVGNYFLTIILSLILTVIVASIFKLSIIQTVGFLMFRISLNFKEIIYAYYQRKSKFSLIGYSQIYITICVIILFLIVYNTSFPNRYVFYLCSFLIFGSMLIDYKWIDKKTLLQLDLTFFKKKLKSGFILGLNGIATSIKVNMPKYFIQFSMQNIELIGVITVYAQIITGLSFLNVIYSRLNLGRVGNLLKKEPENWKTKIYKIIKNNYLIILIFGGLLVLLDRLLIDFVFGAEYTEDLVLFRIMLCIKAITFPLTIIKVISINKSFEGKLTKAVILSGAFVFIFITLLDQILPFMIIYFVIELAMLIYILFLTINNLNRSKKPILSR